MDISGKLVILLRAALSGEAVSGEEFSKMDPQEWEALFSLASAQGVLGVVFGCAEKVWGGAPADIRIKWTLSAENIRRRYERQLSTARELTSLFAAGGLRMIILKGIGLSLYYPRPYYRESGDVDIYFPCGYEESNRTMENMGIKVDYSNPKHAVFRYKGVMVENHRHFLDVSDHFATELEAWMGSRKEEFVARDGLLFPSASMHLIFVLRHTARHFGSTGIALRHLADWGLMMKAEAPAINRDDFLGIVESAGLTTFFNTITEAAGDILGTDLSTLQAGPADAAIKKRFLYSVLSEDIMHQPSGSYLSRIIFRYRRMRSRKWRYDLLLPDDYYRDRLWAVIRQRLTRPRRMLDD